MGQVEQYTIRKKVLKILGAAFHIYDARGAVVAFCKLKAFKLKEDIRIYTREDCAEEFLVMKARNIIDFGATYDIMLPDGSQIGSARRKGLASTFVRDHWLIFDPQGTQIGEVNEDSTGMALARRFVPLVGIIAPQKYNLRRLDNPDPVATYRTHMNIFIRRLGIGIHRTDADLDENMVLAIGCLLTAMERRDER